MTRTDPIIQRNLDAPIQMLGGISPKAFMEQYWQKKPLLIRQAFKNIKPPISATDLRQMVRSDEVESRLIWRDQGQWQMKTGPFGRLPSLRKPDWTLLVQSIDLHNDTAAGLMHRFNFIPAARLDDLMVSIATEGGGVGPHFDSYDVFLIQAQGKRRWRFGQQKDLSLVTGLPLKILADFAPDHDVILEPGDMLYLPPHAAHDGISMSHDCMTLSVGFRAPQEAALAQGMLEAAAEQVAARSGAGCGMYADPPLPGPLLARPYKDPRQAATNQAAQIPDKLIEATLKAIAQIKFDRSLAARYLGCWLTEPHRLAVFDPSPDAELLCEQMLHAKGVGHWKLDRRTRMLYDGSSLYINGELAPVKTSRCLGQLADCREITLLARHSRALNQDTLQCLEDWLAAGWVHWQP